MLQIKTIRDANPAGFDEKVNVALMDGWTLVRRLSGPDYIAEMEKEIITEIERCCENCKNFETAANREPCLSCSNNCSNWEEQE